MSIRVRGLHLVFLWDQSLEVAMANFIDVGFLVAALAACVAVIFGMVGPVKGGGHSAQRTSTVRAVLKKGRGNRSDPWDREFI